MKLLAHCQENKLLLGQTEKHLQRYASIGLRTLLLAERVLPAEYYEEWASRYQMASLAM